MRDILQNHRTYVEKLAHEKLVVRSVESFARKQLQHTLIKVITGSRRVGKSTLAYQILKNTHFGYVNFDDPDIDGENLSFSNLTKAINEVYDNPPFILFDEIQNVPDWEKYVNSLQKDGKNIVITGSNARMLSSEIATVLTGRSVEIHLLPFSIDELKSMHFFKSVEALLMNGTFPEVVLHNVAPDLYYSSLLESTLMKDIVVRHKLRNILELENLATYLLSTIANLFTYRSLAHKLEISVPRVIDYVSYLEESYLFYTLPRFSFKQSEITRAPHKIYVSDFAFARYNSLNVAKNLGAGFENLFFLELLRRGYVPGRTLFYAHDQRGNEIDFVVLEKDAILKLYQVVYFVGDEKILERECRSMRGLREVYGERFAIEQYLVMNDEGGFKEEVL